jgi:nucleoside-diphosphate-sugar epimerase
MKILLVGGTSSLSRSLIPILSNFSEITTAGRTGCDLRIDLSESSSEYLLPAGIDVLIHTAASFRGKSETEILEVEKVNVLGTIKLCLAAIQAKVKHFVFISSIFATLDDSSEFYSIYSLSKRHAEEMTKFICLKNSLPLTILRPSQIYGNEDYFRRNQPFLYSIIDRAQKGEAITIFGSHDPLRNFIHINDLNMIIAEVIKKKVVGTYSCAQTNDVTFSEIANAAFSAFNQDAKISFDEDKTDILDNIFEKDNSLYRLIDYYPQISIEEGMKAIANYRKKS